MISTSGGNLAIGISLLMRDGFSGPAAAATASMGALEKQQYNLAKSQTTLARNANLMGAVVGAAVIAKMGAWVREGAKFGYTMQYVGSLTQGTTTEMQALDKRAKMLGQTTMATSGDVASGMRYMAMAGMDAKETLDNITAATYLSIATLTELGGKGGTADIMTNIMKGFQIGSEHSARVADVLTTATTGANTNLWDLGEALKYSAATAMDLNVSLEETAAMIMMAGNAGIQGSMAGTAVENMLRYITMATSPDRKKAHEALGMLGLAPEDLKDTQGNLKSIGTILEMISQAGQKMERGNADMQNIYIRLFGVRGKREGSLLLRNLQDYHKMLEELNTGSAGSAERIAQGQMETLEGRMKQWTDTIHNLKISFAEALEPVLIPFLRTVTTIIQLIGKLMDTKFGGFLTIMAAGWVLAKTAAFAFNAIILTIRLVTGQLGIATAAATNQMVTGYNAATTAALRYRAAASGVGFGPGMMMGAAGGASPVKTAKNGRPYIIGPGGGARFLSDKQAASTTRGAKFGGFLGNLGSKGNLSNIMNKGMGYGMGASLLLGLASNAVGTESGGGKALSALSDTVSWGMMGATIGSFVPMVGTAIGGIIGAAGGLLSNLYNQLNEVKDEIGKNDTNDPMLQPKTWKEQAEIFSKLKEGESYSSNRIFKDLEASKYLKGTDKEHTGFSSEITINIDGWEALKKQALQQGEKVELDIGID